MATLEKKIILGIDPGKTGAWALIAEDGEFLQCGTYNDRYLLDIANVDHAVLEKVSARPGQGVTSTFTFGTCFGIWMGLLEAFNTPYDLITPQRWQKEVLDFVPARIPKPENETAKDGAKRLAENRKKLKAGIVEFVCRRYPELTEFFALKKNWDSADAICLALYGVRK